MTSAWTKPIGPRSARSRARILALAATALAGCSTPRSVPHEGVPPEPSPQDALPPPVDLTGSGGARPDVTTPGADAAPPIPPRDTAPPPADVTPPPPDTLALPPPSPWRPAIALGAGTSHTCAVLVDGTIRCWGKNDVGQLGRPGSDRLEPRPLEVPGITDARAVSGGSGHTCAIIGEGAVWCWGWNVNGQLGNGTFTDTWRPSGETKARGIAGATAIAIGTVHTCALASGGVWCWGGFAPGGGDWMVPSVVPGLEGATAVALGMVTRCAVAHGKVRCWGENGSMSGSDVAGLENATAVTVGQYHRCALASGTARCWGANFGGALGIGAELDYSSDTPVQPNVPGTVAALATGWAHTCALTRGGTVWCWGDNNNGQLGVGAGAGSNVPVQVGVSGATAIAAGSLHTCVVLGSGSVSCWGSNLYGQLGTGSAGGDASSATPVPVVTM